MASSPRVAAVVDEQQQQQQEEEHRRKRVRKGTRSCWECKRRKVRCLFPDVDAICRGCEQRGTACVSQEFEDRPAPSGGVQLGQRLGRVERMLEMLMQRLGGESSDLSPQTNRTDASDGLGIDVLTPTSSTPSGAYENAPILSLFDNAVFRKKADDRVLDDLCHPNSSRHSAQSSSPSQQSHAKPKLDKLRETLIALLPSRKVIHSLYLISPGWLLVKKHVLPKLSRSDLSLFNAVCDTNSEADVHPNIVARLLLCLALCIQQLPPGSQRIQVHSNVPLDELEKKYIATVANFVTSDDELIGSMDGLECLLLQGVYQLNAGNFRRAWLSFRRALTVGQLLGLQRFSKNTFKPRDPFVELRGKYLWYLTVKSDRNIALLLGLPSGTPSNSSFSEGISDIPSISISPSELYCAQLCDISSLILDRNDGEETRAFAASQEIDDKLDNLSKTMSADWWEVPGPSFEIPLLEAADIFDKLVAQIWHFQLEALLHLPFMYRAAQERRYEYSKISCLRASREIVKRWLYLGKMHCAPVANKLLDFQAFTCCITLLLGILSPRQGSADVEQDKQEVEDRMLVRSAIIALENRPPALSDKISAQSIEVLNRLESIDIGKPCAHGGSVSLTIPHFGTINVIGGACRRASNDMTTLQYDTVSQGAAGNGNEQQQQMPPTKAAGHTTVNFESAFFPPVGMDQGDWRIGNADAMLFDSLLDFNIEGDWAF